MAIEAGLLLALGPWTPVAGVLAALIELRLVFLGTVQVRAYILLPAVGAALAGWPSSSIDSLTLWQKALRNS